MRPYCVRVRAKATGAVLVCALFFVPLLQAGQQSKGTRVVNMEITVRDGVPPLRIAAREGEAAVLEHPDLGKFEFKPAFQRGKDTVVLITISDASGSPSRKLADVEVAADGKQRVQAKMSPAFLIRIAGIVDTKNTNR